ncbi:transport permease protein [Desulfolithobacter dissulfuricans]|uniref:Transport permease protein n=2 Tax=Desulfolithobacter dissulfuricans TaxID=2795293 RepID=A0A915U2U9_9BACT|nr:transport permease protein [Desulfolithobacter dissulfuricans]
MGMKALANSLLLIKQKSTADLISEARRGYIGILWWVIEPVLYMSVFYLIFVVLFNRGGKDNVAFLLTGMVAWKWFVTSIPQCAGCISSNIGLIRQVYVPKVIFPGTVLLTSTIKFLIVFLLLVGFLMLTGKSPDVSWLSLPLLIFVQMLLMLALGSFLAAIIPFFPDLKLIVDNGMILLFFLSGVFFDVSSAPAKLKAWLSLNPMVGIIQSYRQVLLDASWPDWFFLATVCTLSLMLLALDWMLLRRYDRVYAKMV